MQKYQIHMYTLCLAAKVLLITQITINLFFLCILNIHSAWPVLSQDAVLFLITTHLLKKYRWDRAFTSTLPHTSRQRQANKHWLQSFCVYSRLTTVAAVGNIKPTALSAVKDSTENDLEQQMRKLLWIGTILTHCHMKIMHIVT